MFGLVELESCAEFAAALLECAVSGEPLPRRVAARFAPFQTLLGPEMPPAAWLQPVFSSVGQHASDLHLPPLPLSLDPKALFPSSSSHPAAGAYLGDAASELKDLTGQLLQAPPELAHIAFEPLHAWMQRYGTNLPATVGGPTIPLFRQFSLVTACYAASRGLEPAERFTIIGSDTPGIQRFIGRTIASKGVAKGLRGRSVFLQLLTDAVGRRLLDTLQLPRSNLLYAAGGNLLVLAPTGVDAQLADAARAISLALLDWSDGELDQVLAWTSLPADAIGHDVGLVLGMLRRKLALAKRRPYADLLGSGQGYAALFSSDSAGDHAAHAEDFDDLAVSLARGGAGGARYLHRRRGPLPAHAPSWQALLHRVSGGWIYDINEFPRPHGAPTDHLTDAVNQPERVPGQATGFRFMGITTPRDPDGSIREVERIADVTPMSRIGVLRMDVDNLGAIFGRELQPATLAGVCTLSDAIDRFFAGWFNVLCEQVEAERLLAGVVPPERGDLLYTIYSGGDDLFVVGAWDRLPVLADAVRRDFARYCAGNPLLHVSAGIAIEDARFPLYQLAERAADALDAAKALRHPTRARDKNALSLFGQVLPWEAFEPVRTLVASLSELEAEPSALLGRLRDLARLDHEERLRLGVAPADPFGGGAVLVGRAQWRGLIALRRAAEQARGADEPLRSVLANLERQLISGTLTPYLALAARWADLLWRRPVVEGRE